jgi:hypothetical protein
MIYGPVLGGEKIVGGTKLEIIGLQKKKKIYTGVAGRGTTPVWVLFLFLSASICVMHVVSMLM